MGSAAYADATGGDVGPDHAGRSGAGASSAATCVGARATGVAPNRSRAYEIVVLHGPARVGLARRARFPLTPPTRGAWRRRRRAVDQHAPQPDRRRYGPPSSSPAGFAGSRPLAISTRSSRTLFDGASSCAPRSRLADRPRVSLPSPCDDRLARGGPVGPGSAALTIWSRRKVCTFRLALPAFARTSQHRCDARAYESAGSSCAALSAMRAFAFHQPEGPLHDARCPPAASPSRTSHRLWRKPGCRSGGEGSARVPVVPFPPAPMRTLRAVRRSPFHGGSGLSPWTFDGSHRPDQIGGLRNHPEQARCDPALLSTLSPPRRDRNLRYPLRFRESLPISGRRPWRVSHRLSSVQQFSRYLLQLAVSPADRWAPCATARARALRRPIVSAGLVCYSYLPADSGGIRLGVPDNESFKCEVARPWRDFGCGTELRAASRM